MEERQKKLLKELERAIVEAFQGEGSGHDHYHILRVRDNALRILNEECRGDPCSVEAAALLHDVGDPKFFGGDREKGKEQLEEWLAAYSFTEDEKARLRRIVEEVSFKGAMVDDEPSDPEGRIVQDADRLDAIGAIGIARTFAFGGSRGRPIHVPNEEQELHRAESEYAASKSPTIAHFHEKLLLLKGRMKTEAGGRLAEERHRFMETFLDRFHREWNGEA